MLMRQAPLLPERVVQRSKPLLAVLVMGPEPFEGGAAALVEGPDIDGGIGPDTDAQRSLIVVFTQRALLYRAWDGRRRCRALKELATGTGSRIRAGRAGRR